nr:K(+) efflux antiporter 4-like [Tanacetum cinerariifolium]
GKLYLLLLGTTALSLGKLYLLLLGTTALSLVTTPFLFKLIPAVVHLGVLLRWFSPELPTEVLFKGELMRSDTAKRIAPVAIIDRQLPCEYTIASRSTDVIVVVNLDGTSYSKHKPFGFQPTPPAPAANVLAEWNAVYDAHNEVACLMLRSITSELHRQFKNSSPYEMLQELKSMFEKQAGMERFDLIQTFLACKQKEGKSDSQYVLKMKGMLSNWNVLVMKTIGELHAMLIEYEKCLPRKAATLQVMATHGGRIQKAKKKSQNAKGKEVGHWKRNYQVYLAELMKNKKQVGSASSLVFRNDVLYFNAIPSNGIYEIDISNYVPNVNSIYNVSNKRVKHNLDSTYLRHCRLAHISKKRIRKLKHDGF